jgi:tRNA(fMet)-specific endonuclease VapC
VCTIVVGEIRYGLARLPQGRRRRDLEAAATAWLTRFACASIPEAAAEHYAGLKLHLTRRGTPLDENDLWIAATAKSLGAVLVTSDDHFRRVPEIAIENWTT